MKAHGQFTRAILSASIVISTALCATAFAEEPQASDEVNRLRWEVAPEISYFRYKEPGLMKEEGFMYGINASAVYRAPVSKPLFGGPQDAKSWMLRGDARFSWGEVEYEGSLQPSGLSYEIDDIKDTALEFRALIGYDFANEIARTTPYLGFGYRYLRDDGSCDPYGYERESNYLYMPFGFEIHFPSEDEWSLGTTIEYDLLLWGEQNSQIGWFYGTNYGTVENYQRTGNGFRASLRFEKNQPGVDFAIEPFVRLWWIANSDGSCGWHEPKNRSSEVGLKVIWIF